MKKLSRPRPASRRRPRAGLPRDWRPCPFVITRLRPVSPSARPSRPAAAAPPHPGELSPITLDQILDTFARLDQPHSRVFAGLYSAPATDASAPADASSAAPAFAVGGAPLVSGFATPGSRIGVLFADELGIAQDRVTVHSDQNGHWLAVSGDRPRLSPTHQVILEITPPQWSGTTRPERFVVSFPAAEMLTSQAGGPAGLIGSVIPTARAEGTAAGRTDW